MCNACWPRMWRRGFRHERGAAGLERAALAMLRTLGAGKASLLIPQPIAANEQTGLGLIVPLVNEVEMEPVLLQATAERKNSVCADDSRYGAKALSSAGAIGHGRNRNEASSGDARCCERAEQSIALLR